MGLGLSRRKLAGQLPAILTKAASNAPRCGPTRAEGTYGSWRIYVKRWNGEEWESVGGRVGQCPQADTFFPQIVLANAVPYVAFLESEGSEEA